MRVNNIWDLPVKNDSLTIALIVSTTLILISASLVAARAWRLVDTHCRVRITGTGQGTCGQRCLGDLPLTLWKLKPERAQGPLSDCLHPQPGAEN